MSHGVVGSLNGSSVMLPGGRQPAARRLNTGTGRPHLQPAADLLRWYRKPHAQGGAAQADTRAGWYRRGVRTGTRPRFDVPRNLSVMFYSFAGERDARAAEPGTPKEQGQPVSFVVRTARLRV